MAKVRVHLDPICVRTRPQFYKVRDRAYPDDVVWITRSRGRATCPQDGSPILSLSKDGVTTHICVTCYVAETQAVQRKNAEKPVPTAKLRSRGPRRVLA